MTVAMREAYRLLTRWWTAFALAISLAMLGAAHAFEKFGGLAPCNLCLKQREVYWGAVAVAGVATLWHLLSRGSRGTPRIAAFLLFVIFATGAATAIFHAGGEWDWWSLPASCQGGAGTVDAASVASLLDPNAPPIRVVGCDEPAWVFAGISMAGWNALVSIALAGVSLLAAKRPKDARAPR
jgi:disulfide bond formation protein DsbB